MNKQNKFALAIYIIIIISSCKNENRLEVKCLNEKLQISDFTLKFQSEEDSSLKVIFKNNKQINPINSEYGKNRWFVLYKDSIFGETGNLILNRNAKYNYSFKFTIENSKILGTLAIKNLNNFIDTFYIDKSLKFYPFSQEFKGNIKR